MKAFAGLDGPQEPPASNLAPTSEESLSALGRQPLPSISLSAVIHFFRWNPPKSLRRLSLALDNSLFCPQRPPVSNSPLRDASVDLRCHSNDVPWPPLRVFYLRHSFGYGGTAKKSHSRQFEDYGETYGQGDVIGCCLDCNAKVKRSTWSPSMQPISGLFAAVPLC